MEKDEYSYAVKVSDTTKDEKNSAADNQGIEAIRQQGEIKFNF